jgi:hypothetical protein
MLFHLGTKHQIVDIDGKKAWEAFYPRGSRNPSSKIRGGFGFYMEGPESWNITAATELTFSYAVMFEREFEWKRGGKLPGLCESPLHRRYCIRLRSHSWWRRRICLRMLRGSQGESR